VKILILSDIHGNLPALEAILEREKDFDACLFLGDVVDYGPNPRECIHFLMDQMDAGVMGNHDNALAHAVDCGCRGDFKRFSVETRGWHSGLLGKEENHFLQSLPPMRLSTIQGLSTVMAHATPEGNLSHYLQENELAAIAEKTTAQLILLGHTHVQFKKQVGDIIIVNPGSVGLARDGTGACYGIMTDGVITLYRIPYDTQRTIDALWKSPISIESKKGLEQVLRGNSIDVRK
jgi:putative phosphoesterase